MKVKDGFILREVNKQPVVVSVGAASKIFHGMIKLNSTGAFLFEKLQKETSEEELVKALVKKYEVEEDVAKNDVKAFVDSLEKPGIIE